MSTVLQPQAPVRRSARDRRAEKRRLRRMDALSGRLAELYAIRALLQDAAVIVSAGWVQGAWFTVADAGRTRTVTAYDLSVAETRPVIGACLVGAVVQSAGGPREVGTQLVQRSLDLLWHSMREDPRRPVRWCPGPRVRMMHVLELTYWNDAPQRTADEVSALLRDAARTADLQATRCRDERAVLARA